MHFKHADSDMIDSLDTAPGQAASPYGSSKSDGNEFHDAEGFYDNSQESVSVRSAKVSDDDQPNQGVLEERVMFKRWLNEHVKDGPYAMGYGGNTS